MSCVNFIIMKVNGADVSNLPYEDAVQLFLNADEPIIVEVRKKCTNEKNKLNFFNYDNDSIYKSPTLAVIASSSSVLSSTTNTPMLSHLQNNFVNELPITPVTPIKSKPSLASISCQTDLSAFDSHFQEFVLMKNDDDDASKNESCLQTRSKPGTKYVVLDNFDDYMKTEFDFEEITLKRSKSAENLGFTISYSTDDFLESDSGSDEYEDDGEIKKDDRKFKDEKKYNLLNGKYASRCKIYVSDIVPNSLADQDGRLRQGDRILQINGQDVLEKFDPDKLLTDNKYSVKILVSRYAFSGDDDFLDSAVYCDDKECQDDKHISLNEYEYEQNTFSLSQKLAFELSKQDESTNSATTTAKAVNATKTSDETCQILPSIATENICDIFSHANIKVQLETVSKEISFLNSQISLMKQLQIETSMSLEEEQHQQQQQRQNSPFSPKEFKKKALRSNNENQQAGLKKLIFPTSKSPQDVEHIYETIPEDSDVYYCSPFEGVSERRVEEWLKSIGCSNTNNHNTVMDKNQQPQIYPLSARLQKQSNSVLDDYDNSSSAYNTGGSCSSAFLALDSKPKVTVTNYRENSQTSVSKALKKRNHSTIQPSQCINVSRKADILIDNNCQIDPHRTQKPSDNIPFTIPAENMDAAGPDSDGHSTLVAKSSIYRVCQSKTMEEYKGDKDISGMVWKVKRRPDGSRYIVRRITKKHSAPVDKNLESSVSQPQSVVATDVDYKRQLYRVKERSRSRQYRAPTLPSKDKPQSQHWLV